MYMYLDFIVITKSAIDNTVIKIQTNMYMKSCSYVFLHCLRSAPIVSSLSERTRASTL